MKLFLLTLLCAFAATSFGATERAFAAEIARVSRPTCKLRLTGEIVDDDVKRMAVAAKAAGMLDQNSSDGDATAVICLHSSGGSFQAGLALAQYFAGNGIRTFIDNGDTCLSACAVAFLGGRANSSEVDAIYRTLHVGGTLGFHAPFLVVPGGNYDKATVESAYLAATRAMGEFTKLSADKGAFAAQDRVKTGLLTELLQRGPSEMFYIDTVDKAGRWDIQIAGVQEIRAPERQHYVNACANAPAWTNDKYSATAQDPAADKFETLAQVRGKYGRSTRALVAFHGYVSQYCYISIKERQGRVDHVSIVAIDQFRHITYGNVPSDFPSAPRKDEDGITWMGARLDTWSLYSPKTTLRSLR